MGEGREGDWECGGCRNRNYAFRSLCNLCKQPRLLVDTKTPADSKWLPRIGDWICTGCSNNNYASREICKKCGQPKERAAISEIAGSSLPESGHYFSRVQGLPGLKMNFHIAGNSTIQESLLPHSDCSFGGPAKYGLQPNPTWPFNGTSSTVYSHSANAFVVPEGWRNGDWICKCGFHNYSSRSQCKECNAPLPSGSPSALVSSAVSDIYPALGTKRLASDEFVHGLDNKRLNAGYMNYHFMVNDKHSYQGLDQQARANYSQIPGMYSKYPIGNTAISTSLRGSMQSPQLAATPVLIGKGAKQWRDGDWMCSQCDNHNFASRSHCNRCKTPKEPPTRSGSAS